MSEPSSLDLDRCLGDARRTWFKSDPAHWALYCLARHEAHEIDDRPLTGTVEVMQQGWAKVTRRYSDPRYNIQVVTITESGRRELERAIRALKNKP